MRLPSVLLAITLSPVFPSFAYAECISNGPCSNSGMGALCKKAYQRYENTAIYETNGAALIVRAESSGSLTCVAQMKCDSSGGFHRFIGDDLKKSFAAIVKSCGSCGGDAVSGASNCWLQVLGCENCSVKDAGDPVGHLTTSKQQTSTKTSTKKSSTSTPKPPPSTSTKKQSTSKPPSTSKRPSSTSKAPAPPASSSTKKQDPPPSTTKQNDPPPQTTSKKPDPTPEPDKEEKDTESAQKANDSYQKDPTNKSLAEKLLDSIKKALESTKKAVQDAVDEGTKGAEQGLQKALEDAIITAGAAAAGPTAATAAAVAASMAAVEAAKNSVKNAKDNKPTNKPPTTTFKTSKTSKTTTSSTSSTSCVNLGGGDDSLPIETPPEEKRSISEETGEIHSDWKRQSPRDTTICKGWTVPLYESWHAPPKSNAYTKFYDSTYRLNMASCTDVKFDLYEKSTGRARKDYATEHVYELQMIKQFLAYMWLNDEGIKAWRARPENVAITDFCELYNGFLYVDAGDTPWWDTSADLGFPDDLLESVVGELSSGARDEMVYLESYMNGIKAVMFGGRTSLSFNGWEQQLAASVRMASTLLYLKDADIVTIYQKVSKRMYNMWFKIDGEVAEHPDADLKGAEFANGYLKWEKQFLERMETQWINRPKNEALAAKNKIDSKKDGFAGQKVVSNIDIEIQSGNLDPNKLKFAQGLLAWNTQRP